MSRRATRRPARWTVQRFTALAGLGLAIALSSGIAKTAHAQSDPNRTMGTTGRILIWPIYTREHVDLWLHGFAMLDDDTTAMVPLFRTGYRDNLTVLKNKANLLTQLDVNVDRLRDQLHKTPLLANTEFIALYFGSLDEMESVIQQFVATGGDAGSAKTRNDKMLFAMLNSYFPTPAARSWLALFSSGLWDEESKFFHTYWIQQQHERGPAIDSVETLWKSVRPRLQGFLNNSQQRDGDILLSLPLGGEGRTMTSHIPRATVTVTFPEHPTDAADAIYVFAHEIMGNVAHAAIQDNVTPAQQRSGAASQFESPAAVRGGLLLLEKFTPELADGYARYYIQVGGKTPGTTPQKQLETVFPIPDAIRDAMAKQLEIIQGGI